MKRKHFERLAGLNVNTRYMRWGCGESGQDLLVDALGFAAEKAPGGPVVAAVGDKLKVRRVGNTTGIRLAQ